MLQKHSRDHRHRSRSRDRKRHERSRSPPSPRKGYICFFVFVIKFDDIVEPENKEMQDIILSIPTATQFLQDRARTIQAEEDKKIEEQRKLDVDLRKATNDLVIALLKVNFPFLSFFYFLCFTDVPISHRKVTGGGSYAMHQSIITRLADFRLHH